MASTVKEREPNSETSEPIRTFPTKNNEIVAENTSQMPPPNTKPRVRLADLLSTINYDEIPVEHVYAAKYKQCLAEKKEIERKMDLGLLTWEVEQKRKIETVQPQQENPKEEPEVSCSRLPDPFNGQQPPPVQSHQSKETAKLIQQIDEDNPVFLIDSDNSLLDFSDDEEVICEDDEEVICEEGQIDLEENRNVTVRIVDIRGNVTKYSMLKKDNFSKIIRELAAEHKIDEARVMLLFKEINVKVYHTPALIGWRIGDVIEFYKLDEPSNLPLTEADKANKITLKVQSATSRKRIEITINKVDPISKLMQEYAKQSGQQLSKLTFKFDDDVIEPESTPEDLDMDSGDCIDVVEIK